MKTSLAPAQLHLLIKLNFSLELHNDLYFNGPIKEKMYRYYYVYLLKILKILN